MAAIENPPDSRSAADSDGMEPREGAPRLARLLEDGAEIVAPARPGQGVAATPLSAAVEATAAPAYRRYRIATAETADLRPLPHRFLVQVNRFRLARLLLAEVVRYFGRWEVVASRPCIYGVFSGPVGGFKPRPEHCVGCLRCTIQHPDVVRILPNPELARWGDGIATPQQVETLFYEAAKGAVPVKGQGYRGRFGGSGWDGMWTDMSEIVRPTRDGIHGRELISTVVDVGPRAMRLEIAPDGSLAAPPPRTLTLQLPLLLELPTACVEPAAVPGLAAIWARAAAELETLAVLPLAALPSAALPTVVLPAVAPLVAADEVARLAELAAALGWRPALVEIAPPEDAPHDPPAAGSGLDAAWLGAAGRLLPESILALRLPFAAGWRERLLDAVARGWRVFHLVADLHGRGAGGAAGDPDTDGSGGEWAVDLLVAANRLLVEHGVRDQVTLLGSGGIVAAEHVPKAIIAGLDAVALDVAALLALQFRPVRRPATASPAAGPEPVAAPAPVVAPAPGAAPSPAAGPERAAAPAPAAEPRPLAPRFEPPPGLTASWGVQRLENLCASWRDQLLEVMGAMGIREVRRLRGELGRAMFQRDLEAEAFGEIEGFPGGAR